MVLLPWVSGDVKVRMKQNLSQEFSVIGATTFQDKVLRTQNLGGCWIPICLLGRSTSAPAQAFSFWLGTSAATVYLTQIKFLRWGW